MGWRERQGETGYNRDVLWRIVALLFVLAALADFSAGLSARRRRDVLRFLARGETAARDFALDLAIGGMLHDPSAPADTPDAKTASGPFCGEDAVGPFGTVPASAHDAMCLAVRLRALALILCLLLAGRSELAGSGRWRFARDGFTGPAGTGQRVVLPAPDTS